MLAEQIMHSIKR